MKASQGKLFRLYNERFDDLVFASFTRTNRKGKTFFVDSNTGNALYGGTRLASPFASIVTAMAACTANQGDKVVVLPQHSETITTTVDVKAGVQILGLSEANRRPIFSINGATDMFNMNGAGAELNNVDMTIDTTDLATALINVAAAKCAIKNVKMIPSASTTLNVVDCITLAAGADDVLIEGVNIFNTVAPVTRFLSIEAAIARMVLRNCMFFGDIVTGGITDAATATQMFWENVNVAVVGASKPAATLANNSTGLIKNCNFSGTSTTIATNAALGTGVRLFDVKVLEETNGSAQGANIPAVDAD